MDRLKFVQEYQTALTKYRKTIPDKYNQIELANELMNEDLDFYISISNRSDGKSFNYIGFLMKFAIDFGVGFTLVGRHFTLRYAYIEFIEKLCMELKQFNSKDVSFNINDHYVSVIYNEKPIGVITDLNKATDLKYHSNYLKDFPIIIYDEFLALENDYLIDEWEKIKTIYESIDRNHGNIPYIKIPKIFLLGNAVNFSSPMLANLDIFNILQRHPINTMKQYDNVLLEMRKNENSNETRNTRAFKSDDDAMSTGEFDYNDYNLTDDALRNHIASNGDYFYIKTDFYYLKVSFNIDDMESNIQVVPYTDNYQFCTNVSDVKDGAIYLKELFYDENHHRKYYQPSNLHFDNAYSKNYVVNDMMLIELKINTCIRKYIGMKQQDNQTDELERHEKMYHDNYIERSKRALVQRFS